MSALSIPTDIGSRITPWLVALVAPTVLAVSIILVWQSLGLQPFWINVYGLMDTVANSGYAGLAGVALWGVLDQWLRAHKHSTMFRWGLGLFIACVVSLDVVYPQGPAAASSILLFLVPAALVAYAVARLLTGFILGFSA